MGTTLATEKQYAAAAKKTRDEHPEFRSGGHAFHANIRKILNEQGIITHSQLQNGAGEGVILVTSR